jgi:hypothetical protein
LSESEWLNSSIIKQNYSLVGPKKYNSLSRPICTADRCVRDVKGNRWVGRTKCLGCDFVRRLFS